MGSLSLAFLALFVCLGCVCVEGRVQPPVSISLTTKWRSTSLSCEVLEFVGKESPNKYWPFLHHLLQDPSSGQSDYYPKKSVEAILSLSEQQQLDMAMDLRMFSPRVAMHYQVAEQEWKTANTQHPSQCEEKQGTWVIHTPSLTPLCSLESVKSFVEEEKDSCTPFEGAIYLPQDLERQSQGEGDSEWVLYTDLEEANGFLSYFEENHIPFIFRYNQKTGDPSSSEWEATNIQGYGVRIDLKKMEYRAVDDSSSSSPENEEEEEGDQEEMENAEIHGFYFGRLVERKPELVSQLALFRDSMKSLDISPEESVEYYKTIKPWDLKRLPVRAAQRILKSSDPLLTLLDITQNLPSHAKLSQK